MTISKVSLPWFLQQQPSPPFPPKPVARETSPVYLYRSSTATRFFSAYPSTIPVPTVSFWIPGAQITMVDLSLAAELHLSAQGAANVVSAAGSLHSASFAAGRPRSKPALMPSPTKRCSSMTSKNLNSANRPIRGILGEDFLGRFDMLIDNAHSLLCLDDSATMRANVRGPRIALDTSAQSADSQSLPGQFIVAVRLSHGERPVRLKLDSGSNVSLLYNVSEFMTPALVAATSLQGNGVDGVQQAFSALPPQDVRIGALNLSGVLFVILRGTGGHANMEEDGVLATGLFRRVFVDHVNHFAVLDLW